MPNVYQGDGGSVDVYNPDETPGVTPAGYAPPQHPPAQYNVGPPAGQSYYHAPPASPKAAATAPDPWKDVVGAVHDQSVSLVEKFLASLGWPKAVDANAAALALAKSGVNITADNFAAYGWLYWHAPGITGDLQKNNPWAKYGLDKISYQTTVSKLNSVYSSWTGDNLPGDVTGGALDTAIIDSWTPDQLKNFATFGNAEGTGQMLPQAQMSGTMPWLSQGQSYQQTLSGFTAFETHNPQDKSTLAAWFRFGVSAKQLGGAAEPVTTAHQVQGAGSVIR